MPPPDYPAGSDRLPVDALLSVVLAGAQRLFVAEGGSIMLLVGSEELEVVASPANAAALGAKVRFGEGVAGRVATTCDAALVSGRDDSRSKPLDSGMCVPLMHAGKIFGVLNINAASGRTFTDHDLVAATEFAASTADALAEARLYQAERIRGGDSQRHLDATLACLRDAASVDFVEPGELGGVDAIEVMRSLAEGEMKAGRKTTFRGLNAIRVRGDEALLRRALQELVDNGHRHGEAPVRISQETESDDHTVISVSDSGPGVPLAERQRILEPYGRLGRDTDAAGTGLGLTIARRLLEHMGGSLSVVDSPDGGIAFRARLRIA